MKFEIKDVYDQLIEECSETIKTIIKNKRSKLFNYRSNNKFEILNEINNIEDLLKNHKQDLYENDINDLEILLSEYKDYLKNLTYE